MKTKASSILFVKLTACLKSTAATDVNSTTNLFASTAVDTDTENFFFDLTENIMSMSIPSIDVNLPEIFLVPEEVENEATNLFSTSNEGNWQNSLHVPSTSTLTNQILCGYQGWFAWPGDGAPINIWKHWFSSANDPSVDKLTIDMYPSTDEYDPSDLMESNILMNDGSKAKFFSSAKPNVVKKHFEWMRDYGISGVFHMRFMEDINLIDNRDWKTMVLRNVRAAAEATDRVFAVSYNIAGKSIDNSVLDDIKIDWMNLVDNEQITASSQYIRHNGIPVLRIYGIGFKAVNVSDTAKLAEWIQWFKTGADPKYRVFLIGGVPSRWRSLSNDSREEPEWQSIYRSLDGIHPWHVGRWSSISNFNTYFEDTIAPDAALCASLGILYMPTMWPGFSWYNLKKGASPTNSIPRLGGNFMWQQAYQYANNTNINAIWMAQFDEVDEGTAIFKVAKNQEESPAEGSWLALDADGTELPNDWYLQLCGEAQKMLLGLRTLTRTIPLPIGTPSPTRKPSDAPTKKPTTGTPSPTGNPTNAPTKKPTTGTPSPTGKPSDATRSPSKKPTQSPTKISVPTSLPTNIPTKKPTTKAPISLPTTRAPTKQPVTISPTLLLSVDLCYPGCGDFSNNDDFADMIKKYTPCSADECTVTIIDASSDCESCGIGDSSRRQRFLEDSPFQSSAILFEIMSDTPLNEQVVAANLNSNISNANEDLQNREALFRVNSNYTVATLPPTASPTMMPPGQASKSSKSDRKPKSSKSESSKKSGKASKDKHHKEGRPKHENPKGPQKEGPNPPPARGSKRS